MTEALIGFSQDEVRAGAMFLSTLLAWGGMKRRRSAVATLVTPLVFLLVIVLVIRQRTSPRPRQHSTPELPVPEMQSRDRATERPRQREYGDRSERARPRDESCRNLGVTCSSEYFRQWQEPAGDSCTPSTRRGYPLRRCDVGGSPEDCAAIRARDDYADNANRNNYITLKGGMNQAAAIVRM